MAILRIDQLKSELVTRESEGLAINTHDYGDLSMRKATARRSSRLDTSQVQTTFFASGRHLRTLLTNFKQNWQRAAPIL